MNKELSKVVSNRLEGYSIENKTPIEMLLQVDDDGKVSARDTYKFLELSDGQFARWAKSNIINNPFAIENEDYEGFDIYVEGNIIKDYKLTIPFAKKICMISKTQKGEQAREYFIRVEGSLKKLVLTNFNVPSTLSAALRLAADLSEERERLMQEVEILKPQADGYRLIADATGGTLSLNEFAKSMNWGRNRLSKLLRDKGIFIKGGAVPYQQYITSGYFLVKNRTACDGNIYPYSLVTPRGVDYIVKKVQKWGLADELIREGRRELVVG